MNLLEFDSSISINNVYASSTLTGATVCGTNICGTSKIFEGGTCLASTYLGINACACDSAKLGTHLPAYYLNTGSTAICATTAINSKALCGCVPASFLLSGGTAVCTTCAIGAKSLCGCVPASFLLSGGTAVCATSAIDSKGLCGCTPNCFLGATACANDSAKLGNHLPSYYLSTGGTATCACDSAKLGGVLPAGYLLSGGTAVCATSAIDSKALCGCTPVCFLGVNATAVCATCAVGAKSLCGCVPASFLLSGGTAVCATCAVGAKSLCGCIPSCFLGATACACDTAKFNNQLPAYYLNTGSTITCAADSAKLNNKLPSYYLNTGSTAICATCAVGAKSLCGCVPASFLLSGGTAVCATCAGNASTVAGCTPSCFLGVTACACDSKCLGGHLPAYYLNTGTTITCAADSAKLNNKLPAYYLNTGSTALCATCAGNASTLVGCTPSCFLGVNATAVCATCSISSKALCGCVPASFLLSGGTALCATTAGNALCLGGVLPAGYLLSGGTAKNSLCLNGHTEAALSVCNAVCVNGHAEANLSVANSACLGGNLANTYAPLASPNFTTCICTPVMCSTGVVKGTIISGSTCVESPVIQLTTGAGVGCVFTSNATGCGVWCTPAAGGIAWSGSTANGVGTYYSASKICSNPNMTFDGTKLGVTGNICASTCLCSPTICATTCFIGSGAGLTGTAASLKSNDSSCLNGVLPAGYLLSGGTAKNSLCLGGNLAACYAQLDSPAFTTLAIISHATNPYLGLCKSNATAHLWLLQASADVVGLGCSLANSLCIDANGNAVTTANMTAACFVGSGAGLTGTAASLTAGVATTANALCGCVPSCFLGAGATAVCATCAGNATTAGSAGSATVATCLSGYAAGNAGYASSAGSAPASDVYAWAKASVKPSYTYTEVGALAAAGTANCAVIASCLVGVSIAGNANYATTAGSAGSAPASDVYAWAKSSTFAIGAGNPTFSGSICVTTCGTAVDWIATSDCRLKTCIQPISNALSTVMKLQGICYELCNDESHENQIGLSAQDVEKILPVIVSHSKPNEEDAKYGITDDKLGLKYNKLGALLIEAMKEQQKQIEENEKQIHALCLELNYMRNYNK